MANTENMSKKGLKEQTYLTLKERMVDCVYPPGSLINEAQLASLKWKALSRFCLKKVYTLLI